MKTYNLNMTYEEAQKILDDGEQYYASEAWSLACDIVIAALKARIEELEAERTWQPIESAPEGKEILIAIKRNTDKWQFEHAEKTDGYFYPIWGSARDFEPTNWMPLPPAPKED